MECASNPQIMSWRVYRAIAPTSAMLGNARRRDLLRQIRRHTHLWMLFRCNGCDELQAVAPVYSDWECGNCEYSGRVTARDGLA